MGTSEVREKVDFPAWFMANTISESLKIPSNNSIFHLTEILKIKLTLQVMFFFFLWSFCKTLFLNHSCYEEFSFSLG